MFRTVLKFCFTAVIVMLTAGSLIAMPISVKDDPNFVPVKDRQQSKTSEPSQSTGTSGTTEAAAMYQSGDSVYYICNELTFTSADNGGNDCWGWADGLGNQYAIYGSWTAVEFYNTTTGAFVDKVDAPSCSWRDMKTYGHYCYSVSECSGPNEGILIIDMQYLPDSVHYVGSIPSCASGCITSHNISIDTTMGYLYVEGTNSAGDAVRIFDLSNPEAPVYVNNFGPSGGIHDMYCLDDKLYLAEGWSNTFSIWDMTNKAVPSLLTRVTIPLSGYVHNIWPTADGNYVVTTEETSNKTVKIWDVSDYGNVQLLGQYLGTSNLAHNAQVLGDKVYLSHYESGISILDISDPNTPVELATFDTYPAGDSPNFNGCWGVYQYTSNGEVYASNMDGRLYVITENSVTLDGQLTALEATGLPGNQVKIDIHASFNEDMHSFSFPFNWGNGPANLSFDSFSTAGLMTDYFETQSLTAYDPFNDRAAMQIISSDGGTSPNLPAGSGVIASLFFTIDSGTPGDTNVISFTPFNSKEPIFGMPCLAYMPDTTNGSVAVSGASVCCQGIRGNVDGSPESPPGDNGVDVSDLLYMVDFMFATPAGPAPVCTEEGDVDASGATDVSDLLYLVDFMFLTPAGPAPEPCP